MTSVEKRAAWLEPVRSAVLGRVAPRVANVGSHVQMASAVKRTAAARPVRSAVLESAEIRMANAREIVSVFTLLHLWHRPD